MKKHPGIVAAAIFAFVLFVVLVGPSGEYHNGHLIERIAIADRSSTTSMNAQTVLGPGLASIYTAATPTEDPASSFVFQYKGGPGAQARLEISNDSGTNWSTLRVFGIGEDTLLFPVCGACQFRGYAIVASATATNTIIVTVSGAAVAVAPTYTATNTPAVTPTATATKTPTPTRTPDTRTATPTPSKTPTPVNTGTPTPFPINTPINTITPTVTPTRTPTRTPTPTHT